MKDLKELRVTLVLKDPLVQPDLLDHKELRAILERRGPLDLPVPLDRKDPLVPPDPLAHKAPRDRKEPLETLTSLRLVVCVVRVDLTTGFRTTKERPSTDGEGLESAERTTTCHSGYKTLGAPKAPRLFS